MMWTRVQCFRHEYPLLSSILIFFFGIVLGGLFFVIWPPLARGYLVALPVLFGAYELRKRVLVDRSSLVWIPSLVALNYWRNGLADRVVEMAPNRTIVWEFKVGFPHDAERLPNGNTLIAESASQRSVMQVSGEGKIVWMVKDIRLFGDEPLDADWLPNGNILITITDMPESITWSLTGILSIFLLGPMSPLRPVFSYRSKTRTAPIVVSS